MIPADVASRLQVSADTTLRPVAPVQEISDKLSGLVAGQQSGKCHWIEPDRLKWLDPILLAQALKL